MINSKEEAAAKRQGQVLEQLDIMDEALRVLEESIGKLSDKISRVLVQPMESTAANSLEENLTTPCQLASTIAGNNWRIKDLWARIVDLIERCEL